MVEPTSSTAEGAPTIAAGSDDATRGRPYYEKLRNDLKETIEKKQELDRTMVCIQAVSRAQAILKAMVIRSARLNADSHSRSRQQ